ncbi:MAG: IPT/TIG domain-containing protein, partial [Pseudonocardiaceae bacterium]
HLRNSGDVGMQTSVRLRPAWLVRVAEGMDPPAPEPGHAHYRLARLTRPRGNAQITTEMIEDLRRRRLTLTDLEQRVRDIEMLRTLPAFSDDIQFSPPFGAPTTKVALFGRNFDIGGIPGVRFGAVDAASVDTPTPTGVTVTVPAGLPPGKAPITVTTEGGTVVSDMPFDVKGPPPKITEIRPTTGKPATPTGPATVVTITGDHFNENVSIDTKVTFGDEPADVDEITNTTIVTKVPIIRSGAQLITVTTEWGNVISSAPFTVVQGIPS